MTDKCCGVVARIEVYVGARRAGGGPRKRMATVICDRPAGHDGDHQDARGRRWPQRAEPSAVDTTRGAWLSEDGRYRYLLWRLVSPGLARVCFVMLNPSTADAEHDDPTVRRCLSFAQGLGAGRLDVVNLFAYRATDPRDLRLAVEPIGLDNHFAVARACRRADIVIAAWGAQAEHPLLARHAADMLVMVRDYAGARLHHLGLTKGGSPRHPLYLPRSARPIPWRG